MSRSAPSSTESPLFTQMDFTTPPLSAWMLFSIFIASRITTVSPAATVSPTLTLRSRITPGTGSRRFGNDFCASLGAWSGCRFNALHNRSRSGSLFEFHLVCRSVDRNFSDVVLNVAYGNFVFLSVDFIFIFFHNKFNDLKWIWIICEEARGENKSLSSMENMRVSPC